MGHKKCNDNVIANILQLVIKVIEVKIYNAKNNFIF